MNARVIVHNLKCGGCASTIISSLEKIGGLSDLSVDPETGAVGFEYESEDDYQEAIAKLKKLGYPTEDSTLMDSARSYVSCMIGRIT